MPTPDDLERLKRMATGADESPISVSLPDNSSRPSLMAAASRQPLARLLIIIAAAGTSIAGVVTALGAQIVNIITSLRPQSIAALRAELEPRLSDVEKRANAEFGLKQEVTTRQDGDERLGRAIEALANQAKECEALKGRVDKLEKAK